jgi:hypothetical protein
MELTRKTLIALAIGIGAATACSDSTVMPTPAPTPTALRIDLRTPNVDDGAVVVTVRGPELSDLQPASAGYLAYHRGATPDEMRVIVIGDVKGGPLASLTIAPGHQVSEYSATIQQVATRTDALREDLSGYELTVTAP